MDQLNRRRKVIAIFSLLAVVGLLVVASLAVVAWLDQRDEATEQPIEKVAKKTEPVKRPDPAVSFAAMGDMLAHDSVTNQARTADGYDFTGYFQSIKPLYAASDVVFCNPETPAAGGEFGISGYPTFNAPVEFSRDLRGVGCNLINLATNHIADKGQAAIDRTLDGWDQLKPLAVAGASRSSEDQQKVSYFTKNGLKIAFLAFADTSNGPIPHPYSLNLYRDGVLVEELMTQARANADVVMVSVHWGTEDSHTVNDDQLSRAKWLSDLGADAIIGTGPHVLQKVSLLARPDGGQTLVWYSIGNMLSSQLQVDELTGGVAKFKMTKSGGKLIISDISFSPTLMSYQWSAGDRAAGLMHARRDLKLQPLKEAAAEAGLLGVTVDERLDKVEQWLGQEVAVKID